VNQSGAPTADGLAVTDVTAMLVEVWVGGVAVAAVFMRMLLSDVALWLGCRSIAGHESTVGAKPIAH